MPEEKLSARYPTDLPAWKALKAHYRDDMKSKSLADLFKYDKNRFTGYSIEASELTLDYSKNFLNSKTRKLLVKLADKFQEGGGDIKLVGVPEKVIALFDMLGLLSLFKIYENWKYKKIKSWSEYPSERSEQCRY